MHAFISSRLDFCNSLLYGLPDLELKRLQKLQNQAARVVTGAGRFDHITPILHGLHWLPVNQRVAFKVLTFTHKCVHGGAPDYLHLERKVAVRSTRQSTALTLNVKSAKRKNCGDRAFTVCAPTLWNSLPAPMRATEDLSAFKSLLKTFLFMIAFSQFN